MATQQIDGGRQIKSGTITGTQIAVGAAIPNSKLSAWDQNQSANNYKLTNLATPTAAADAATMGYVDSVASGLDIKQSVRAASGSSVAGTYNATGGVSTRGQFTGMPNALGGVTPLVANDRVLLKDQATGAQNGVWVVTTVGSGSDGVWDRAADYDSNAEVNSGAFCFVEEGTLGGTGWVLTTPNPIILGGSSGTSLTYAQFSSSAAITAGDGLVQNGQAFDVVAADTSLTINANSMQVQLNSGGTLDVSTGLRVANSGITPTQLNVSVAGGGLDGGAGTALSVSWSGMIVPSGTPNGILTDFTLPSAVHGASATDATAVFVSLGGIVQRPTTDYTRNNTTLTFTTAPNTGDEILCHYFKA